MQRIFVDEVWRGMLGAETLPALVFFVIIFFIPESPRWLALRGHTDRALRVLGRINGDRAEAAAELAAIETAVGGGQAPQWRLLLSKGIRTAVLVGAAIAILGQFMGVNAVLYYGPSIFRAGRMVGQRLAVRPDTGRSGQYAYDGAGAGDHRPRRAQEAGLLGCVGYGAVAAAYRDLFS